MSKTDNKAAWPPLSETQAAVAEIAEVLFGVGDLGSVAAKWPNCAALMARRREQLAETQPPPVSRRPSNRGLVTNGDLDRQLEEAQR